MSHNAQAGSQPIQLGVGKAQVFSVVILIVIAIGGFAISFHALSELAVSASVPSFLSLLFPVIIDGVMLVATIGTFVLRQRGRSEEIYAWAVLFIFSGISIWGNVRYALLESSANVDTVTACIVAAIPPVSLLFTTHFLAIMVDGGRKHGAVKKTVNKDGEALTGTKGKTDKQILALIQKQTQKNVPTKSADIARWTGASTQSAASKLGRLRKEHPYAFLTPASQSVDSEA